MTSVRLPNSSNQTNQPLKYRQIGKPCISYNTYKQQSNPFKTKAVVVDDSYVSLNNKLVGCPNPKTKIPPIIPTPCYSLDWRASDMIVPNKINARTNEDLHYSGYLSKGDSELDTKVYTYDKIGPVTSSSGCSNGMCSTSMTPNRLGSLHKPEEVQTIEQYKLPEYGSEDWQNQINGQNGYLPQQYETSRFPANLPQGKAIQTSEMADYNRQLFTQTIQPGLYYREDVIEPVSSNIGISFQQEFLPRTVEQTENGGQLIIDNDPNFVKLPTYKASEPEPTTDNIYDPRFNGYGTASRCYIDSVTGQPRFPYDDINAVRMPNYVTRSKIDTQKFSDSYGPIQDAGKSLDEIRGLANDAFYKDTEQHRNDIMSNISRKMNAAKWQQRQAPLLGVSRR
jgi:hypothetical protein